MQAPQDRGQSTPHFLEYGTGHRPTQFDCQGFDISMITQWVQHDVNVVVRAPDIEGGYDMRMLPHAPLPHTLEESLHWFS
jgi:hypothetical protein